MSYYSLASGFLSDKYRTEANITKSSARGRKALSNLNDRGRRILAALDTVASRYDSRPIAGIILFQILMKKPVKLLGHYNKSGGFFIKNPGVV
ncbi:hypothetical protein SAMN04488128_10642 [Chitinophaga eiseniae]|uniref:Uncharacterized protein n=1 Tax=Chitinophaga eiseniae TaxID=634771 RepID=A0A1T4TR31_9BACT|nr:hypothetical protein SAMN04488128_10642 [Chitinophaga eiseniae]